MVKVMVPLLVVCLFFCSCSNSTNNTAGFSCESIISQNTAVSDDNKDKDIIYINSHDGIGANSDQGYYYPLILGDGSHRIMFFDYQSKTSIPLCSRPECTHSDETCTSWYPFTGGDLQLAVIDDHLIAISSNGRQLNLEKLGDIALPQIFISNLDGSNRSQLQQFSANEDLPTKYAIQGNSLLFLVQHWEEKQSESFLVQMDILTGKCKKLTTFPSLSCFLIGANQESLFIKSFEAKSQSNSSAQKGLYDLQDQVIYSYSLATKKQNIVAKYPVKTRIQIFQSKLFIINLDDSSILINDLVNENENTKILLPENVNRQDIYPTDFLDNNLIVDEISTTHGQTQTSRFSINLDSHSFTPLELRTEYIGHEDKSMPLVIYAENCDNLLVVPYLDQAIMSLPDGENQTIELPTLIPELKVISKDDFFSGTMP